MVIPQSTPRKPSFKRNHAPNLYTHVPNKFSRAEIHKLVLIDMMLTYSLHIKETTLLYLCDRIHHHNEKLVRLPLNKEWETICIMYKQKNSRWAVHSANVESMGIFDTWLHGEVCMFKLNVVVQSWTCILVNCTSTSCNTRFWTHSTNCHNSGVGAWGNPMPANNYWSHDLALKAWCWI